MNRLIVVAALVLSACSSSTVGPSATQGPQSPQPVILSMLGGWSGTLTISTGTSNICQETWIITSQSGGNFSGSYQTSGGTTVTCGDAGIVSGVASVNGVSDVLMQGNPGSCVRVGGTNVFAGAASPTSITAQRADTVTCGTLTVNRTLTLLLTKR